MINFLKALADLEEAYKRLEQEYKLQLQELVNLKKQIDKVYRR